MDTPHERIFLEASFNPKVRTYWLLSGCFVLLATIVGIPLIPVWLFVGYAITGHMLNRMKCTLTTRSLKVEKGMFVRVEKTVPLDKITDLGVVQGPVMRHLEIESLSIETAGSTSPTGATLSLTGIENGRAFRDAVLEQRDLISGPVGPATTAASGNQSMDPTANDAQTHAVLVDIRDSLQRIEASLNRSE